ncbi:MAG: protein translocase subunit SecD [Erythrobacter sp.]|uniref:protein translocase subunit SecD n=1 Tax=Erythrobacter sp. TaxID=1042 RepID=UPI002637CAD3|nr:protein translocase subunit SecD [Erythrobacter sp.]MDJ0977137.1 protein translocase subunit SecD [Erythrobacter sp.]
MLDFPLWKKLSLWVMTLALAALAVPSLMGAGGVGDASMWEDMPQVNLGLDLAGGSHLLLEADREDVAAQRLENLEENMRLAMRNAQPRIRIGDISTADGRLSFLLDNPGDVDRARSALEPLIAGQGITNDWDLNFTDTQRVVLSPTSAGIDAGVDEAMNSAVEVVRLRIDNLGTREPTIIRQGSNRIVVQVPGLEDPEGLKELLGETAVLEFKLVDKDALPTNVQAGIAPPGSEIYPFSDESDFAGASLAVERLGGIRGDNLTSASPGKDPRDNRDVVNITFDPQGATKFAKLSTENVGERFAIILDGKIISAPEFNEPILGGSAQISGNFTPESAKKLANQLDSGALPVELTVVEERTVGPDLGADSIRKGLIAMLIGSIAVITLMMATYGRFGIYATVALVFNVLILLGVMAGLNATLTLPGIAGFVLTVGAAVDANVLINERIREERKRGRKVLAAVETGYKEASRAIYDANITNLIAGALLFYFGSGPIRGFAIVLVIGLATTVFTALMLTRMWAAGWLKSRPADINI